MKTRDTIIFIMMAIVITSIGVIYVMNKPKNVIPECICTCDGNSAQLTIETMEVSKQNNIQ